MSRTNQAPIVVVKAARCFGPTTRSSAALARTDSARRLLRDLSHWLRLLLTCHNTNGRASGPAKRMNCSDSIAAWVWCIPPFRSTRRLTPCYSALLRGFGAPSASVHSLLSISSLPSGLAGDVAVPQLGGPSSWRDPINRPPIRLGQTPKTVGGLGDMFDIRGHTGSVVLTTLIESPCWLRQDVYLGSTPARAARRPRSSTIT